MKVIKFFLLAYMTAQYIPVRAIDVEKSKTAYQLAERIRNACVSCDGTPDFNEFCSLLKSVNCVKNKLDILNAKLAGLIAQAGPIITEHIAFQTKILCDQIQDIDAELIKKTLAVMAMLNNINANIMARYIDAAEQVQEIRILELETSRKQTAELRDISKTIARVKQEVCLALVNAQSALNDSLIESQQQVALAVDESSEQIKEKAQELSTAIFEAMNEINSAIFHSGQIIPLQVHESLSKIQVQLVQVTDALLAAIGQIGYGNTDLIQQQVATVQGSINKYSTSYAKQFVKIAKQEGLQANRLATQLIAIQDALVAQQNENAQAVATQAALDNTALAQDTSKASKQLASFVHDMYSKIDNIQISIGALICKKEAEIFEDLVKAFNYLALCIAEVNEQIETLMIVNTQQTQNSFNVRANAVASSIDAIDATVLAATGVLSASLQKVDAQIGQVLRAKISNLETANLKGSNQLSKGILSLQTNIGKQVCQEISDATKNLMLQQENICAKMEQLNADISGQLLQLSTDFQNNIDQTESTLCSKISTIQSDLSNQIVTEVNQALTSLSLARNNFAYVVNSQSNELGDLFISQIQEHNAHMDEQFQIMCSKFCALENDLAMQQMRLSDEIMNFQDTTQANIILAELEIITALEARETAITVILLEIAAIQAEISFVFRAREERSIACACAALIV